jgi:hypothetical protein
MMMVSTLYQHVLLDFSTKLDRHFISIGNIILIASQPVFALKPA